MIMYQNNKIIHVLCYNNGKILYILIIFPPKYIYLNKSIISNHPQPTVEIMRVHNHHVYSILFMYLQIRLDHIKKPLEV